MEQVRIPGNTLQERLSLLRKSLLVIVIAVAWHLLLVANPGYFNHDELQRMDQVQVDGFLNFAEQQLQLQPGPSFSFPVRPIGFLHQGAVSMWMRSWPVLVHLVDVLLHAAAAIALMLLLRQVGADHLALPSALIFTILPTATFATGWVGASFDRLYVGFSLLALAASARGLREKAPFWLLAAAVSSAGAILSKETAIVLPLAVMGLWLWLARVRGVPVSLTAGIATCAAVALPVAAYMLRRTPALLGTLAGASQGMYSVDPANIPGNALAFAAFPFLIDVSWLPNIIWSSTTARVLAVGALACVWLTLALVYRAKAAVAGIFSYFLPLLPVLPISGFGSHYAYGTSVSLAVSLAVLVLARYRLARWFAVACIGWLGVHSMWIQKDIYVTGRCESALRNSLAWTVAAVEPHPSVVELSPAPGATWHVARATLYARKLPAGRAGTSVQLSGGGVDAPPAVPDVRLLMTPGCWVTRVGER